MNTLKVIQKGSTAWTTGEAPVLTKFWELLDFPVRVTWVPLPFLPSEVGHEITMINYQNGFKHFHYEIGQFKKENMK